jgi:hypothetical protein
MSLSTIWLYFMFEINCTGHILGLNKYCWCRTKFCSNFWQVCISYRICPKYWQFKFFRSPTSTLRSSLKLSSLKTNLIWQRNYTWPIFNLNSFVWDAFVNQIKKFFSVKWTYGSKKKIKLRCWTNKRFDFIIR